MPPSRVRGLARTVWVPVKVPPSRVCTAPVWMSRVPSVLLKTTVPVSPMLVVAVPAVFFKVPRLWMVPAPTVLWMPESVLMSKVA